VSDSSESITKLEMTVNHEPRGTEGCPKRGVESYFVWSGRRCKAEVQVYNLGAALISTHTSGSFEASIIEKVFHRNLFLLLLFLLSPSTSSSNNLLPPLFYNVNSRSYLATSKQISSRELQLSFLLLFCPQFRVRSFNFDTKYNTLRSSHDLVALRHLRSPSCLDTLRPLERRRAWIIFGAIYRILREVVCS